MSPIKTHEAKQIQKKMECPVCYESLEARPTTTTPCCHVFHESCLSTWLQRGTTCPSCRTTLAEAPANPRAPPVGLDWFEERHQALVSRIQANRAMLTEIKEGLASIDADKKRRRSEAAKRGAATRAAKRAALLVV